MGPASAIGSRRLFATVAAPSRSHKIVVVGAGTAGLAVSHQLLRTGQFKHHDIAIVDPSQWHDYQPGWTLVGGGLKDKHELRRPLASLVDAKMQLYPHGVSAFTPDGNSVTLSSGESLNYEHLVVAPGIKTNYGSVRGLPEALADESTNVSTIYGFDTCDKVMRTIERTNKGTAIFTQPAGPIKCAGAPQKIMWLALDHWKRAGLYDYSKQSAMNVTFATGMPSMFAVPRYAAKLEELRVERGVEGLFQHDLVSVDGDKATFAKPDGEKVTRSFDLLHVVPKMGPHGFVKGSPVANEAGYVDVHEGTTQHKKFANVWSLGDASSLPCSKTAAAITAEAPVLVNNLLRVMEGKEPDALYDGYASCPLLTEYGKVLLAEFKYGGEAKETFAHWLGDQTEPSRLFWHLKKSFFPWVYYNSMVRGTWGGPKGWLK